MSQVLPKASVQGRSIYYGGFLKVEGKATAIIRMLAQLKNGGVLHREIRLSSVLRRPFRMRDFIEVPKEDDLEQLFVTCAVEGAEGSAFFDDIWATTQMPTDWPQALGEPEPNIPLTASVTIQADRVIRKIPNNLYGQNVEYSYGGNGIWDKTKDTLDQEVIRLSAEMGPKILRFPGGFLSDFYHWSDGIGPPERRPITRPFPGSNFTDHRFGTDEFFNFAKRIGADALLTVNALTGTPREAADWIRYVNKDDRRVEYWEVGNELYVDLSQLDPEAKALTPEQYAERFNAFAEEMRAADPTIKIGAILDHKYSTATYPIPSPIGPRWCSKNAGKNIDFVAVHNAFAPALGTDNGLNVRTIYNTMLAAPVLVKESLAELSAQIDKYLGPSGAKVEVAVTEWAPLFDTDVKSRFLEHPKTLASALYCASVIKAFIEDKRTTLAAAFKLVDALELSWIGIRDGRFLAKAPHYVLHLYTQHFGTDLVASETDSRGYEARSLGWVDAVSFVPYLETVTSKSADGKKLYIMAINKSLDRPIRTNISWTGFCAANAAKAWNLNGTAPDANTGTQIFNLSGVPRSPQASMEPDGRFNRGEPGEIWLDNLDITVSPKSLEYNFPAHSVTAIELSAAEGCSI